MKILKDAFAHYGLGNAEVKKAFWLSTEGDFCNERAIHTIFSMIFFKGSHAGAFEIIRYWDMLSDTTDVSKIKSPFEIDTTLGIICQRNN